MKDATFDESHLEWLPPEKGMFIEGIDRPIWSARPVLDGEPSLYPGPLILPLGPEGMGNPFIELVLVRDPEAAV